MDKINEECKSNKSYCAELIVALLVIPVLPAESHVEEVTLDLLNGRAAVKAVKRGHTSSKVVASSSKRQLSQGSNNLSQILHTSKIRYYNIDFPFIIKVTSF